MKILVFKKPIALFCLLLTEVCSSEDFLIDRGTSKDFFSIPPTNCDKDNDVYDYCSEYNATSVRGDPCKCECNDQQATFSYHKQSWSCLKNEDTRTFFGCGQPTFFDKEKQDDKLKVLKSGNDKRVNLMNSNCKINTISSWYIDCDGSKVTAATGISKFEIEQDSDVYDLEVANVPTGSPLVGRIINLGISCSPPGEHTNDNYCLLFKLGGSTSCPVTVTQTASVVDTVLKSSLATSPTQVFTPPDSAADQSIADDNSALSLGAIVGVTVGGILIAFLVGHFIYRRHSARKHPRTTSEGHSCQSDSESQPRDQNEGYETLSSYRSAIYTSNYAVPNSGSEDERAHQRSPRVASATERNDNDGREKDEPFYSTVDELCSGCNGKHAEYVDPTTSERSHVLGPLSVEQRVYNIIEDLNISTSDSPYNYGSNEGSQDEVPLSAERPVSNIIEVLNTDTLKSSYDYVDPASSESSLEIGPLSVEQRVYNMMEVLNTNNSASPYEYVDPSLSERSRDIGPLSVEQRVYNMIEDFDKVTENEPSSPDPSHKEMSVFNDPEGPLQKGAEGFKKNCTVKDPVYNVLEGPDPEQRDEPRNDTLNNIKQQDNNSSTFLYAVA